MRQFLWITIIGLTFFSCQQSSTDSQNGNEAEKDTTQQEKEEQVELKLPKPSPEATVFQRVGITDVKIHYYRPSVRDRVVWGNPVEMGKIWRTGANKATSLEFSNDVKINGHSLKAGKYSFFTIPRKDKKWTVIFNKKTDMWGTGDYKKENDALRFKLATDSTTYHEMMTFEIRNVTPSEADINLIWKHTRLPLKLSVETDKMAMANIEKALSKAKKDNWRVYAQAADYCLESGQHLDKGLKWINKSISIKEYWWNHWVKSELLAKQGNYKEAIKVGKKAIQLGEEQEEEFPYKKNIQKQIEGWKKEM